MQSKQISINLSRIKCFRCDFRLGLITCLIKTLYEIRNYIDTVIITCRDSISPLMIGSGYHDALSSLVGHRFLPVCSRNSSGPGKKKPFLNPAWHFLDFTCHRRSGPFRAHLEYLSHALRLLTSSSASRCVSVYRRSSTTLFGIVVALLAHSLVHVQTEALYPVQQWFLI